MNTTNQLANDDAIELTEARIQHASALWDQLRHDRHRPQYHFLPPAGWMNDINGPLFWKGRYHIFYQTNPEGAYWKRIQWGHASSLDLVHWTHHPIALEPTPGGPDRDGCFSGGAIVNNGVPTLIYHGVPEGTCLATCTEDDLNHWTKHPANPVIRVPQPGDPGFGQYRVYDPCAWRHHDAWYALCGSLDPNGGDTAYLFRSADLLHWDYVNPFYQSKRRWTEVDEDCAVPDFFPLGSKHMLLFCSHLQGTQYYIGQYRDERFIPEKHARMSWPGGHLGGGISMLDGQGRRLYFDWIRELRGAERERVSGWSGVMTLPRILSLPDDGELRIDPVPEIAMLRHNPHVFPPIDLAANQPFVLDPVRGTCLEIELEVYIAATQSFALQLCCSPDGAEQTSVIVTPAQQALQVDCNKSSLDQSIGYAYYRNAQALQRVSPEYRRLTTQTAPLALEPGERLYLHVFLDRSVLEVFANHRQCITQRIYPTRDDSTAVNMVSFGSDAKVTMLNAWNVAPANAW